jgi:hypothetical protein
MDPIRTLEAGIHQAVLRDSARRRVGSRSESAVRVGRSHRRGFQHVRYVAGPGRPCYRNYRTRSHMRCPYSVPNPARVGRGSTGPGLVDKRIVVLRNAPVFTQGSSTSSHHWVRNVDIPGFPPTSATNGLGKKVRNRVPWRPRPCERRNRHSWTCRQGSNTITV